MCSPAVSHSCCRSAVFQAENQRLQLPIESALSCQRADMGRHFRSEVDIKSPWHQVLAAFWQRYPNPYSAHVLTEDVLYREVTPSNHLLSRRLLTKTNRLPGWAERVFPAHMARAVYVLEDSVVDPQSHTLTTKTWNLNHNALMEFGLARFKSNQAKAVKGLEYALSKIQTEAPPHLHGDQGESSEKHKPLPPQATPTSTQKPKQFV
ncbi:PRELI domain-containing protein 1, mitochondrial-like isoform X5 [Siniperca chuatsi]|uniref:PRELI domain-containing protein 1, mitochondrial-like isoform X5 n=1 Tax=Siniperca chuatsi TaxID=119488 RepID=UPI001CE0DF3F|nr:PRELI domain-containing protein 1, mitochondrial-like isoform X5 [Siniperca chuatsi]